MSKRNSPHPRKSNKAPRQMIDEAMIRRIGNTDPHGTAGGRQLTGGAATRSGVDSALINQNGN
jgi:hypothetical protein